MTSVSHRRPQVRAATTYATGRLRSRDLDRRQTIGVQTTGRRVLGIEAILSPKTPGNEGNRGVFEASQSRIPAR
jgi:hypothetical protein